MIRKIHLSTILTVLLTVTILITINIVPRTHYEMTNFGWPTPYYIEWEYTGHWEKYFNPIKGIEPGYREALPIQPLAILIDVSVALAVIAIVVGFVLWLQGQRPIRRILRGANIHEHTEIFFIGMMALSLFMNLIPYGVVCCGETRISAPGLWPSLGWPLLYYQYITYGGMTIDTFFSDQIVVSPLVVIVISILLSKLFDFYVQAKSRRPKNYRLPVMSFLCPMVCACLYICWNSSLWHSGLPMMYFVWDVPQRPDYGMAIHTIIVGILWILAAHFVCAGVLYRWAYSSAKTSAATLS
jgi:hypothetical protein